MLRLAHYGLWSISVALCALAGCSDRAKPPEPSQRGDADLCLIDAVADATIQSSLDLTTPNAAMQGAPVLYDSRDLDADGSRPERILHPAEAIEAILPRSLSTDVDDRSVWLLRCEMPSRTVLVEVETESPLAPNEQLIAIRTRLPIESLTETTNVRAIFDNPDLQVLPIPREETGASRYRLVLERVRRSDSVIICVIGSTPFIDGANVRVLGMRPRHSWLLEHPRTTASPWVRAVELDESTRESIILGIPGSARFHLLLAESAERLSLAFAPFVAPPESVTLQVVVRQGEQTARTKRTVTRSPERPEWTDLELDLRNFAGDAIDLTFSVTSPEQSQGMVALANPRVIQATDDRRPDIVLISLDTVRASSLSLYGNSRRTSPHVDDLAKSSVVFDAAISTAAWTLPSHVSMMTGLYPDRHGAYTETSTIHAETPLLAEQLRDAGYRTLGITGGGFVSPQFGFGRGFERYDVSDPAYPPSGFELGPVATERLVERSRRATAVRDELVTLLKQPRTVPRFFFIHTYAAHNYTATTETLRSLVADGTPTPEGSVKGSGWTGRIRNLQYIGAPELEREAEYGRWLYDGSVRAADALVGEVIAALRASGKIDETIVIVTSDHGELLGEHEMFGHTNHLFEGLIHVPLLIHAPGVVARREGQVVSLVDVAPTLLELAGFEEAQIGGIDGRSLLPLLRGEGLPSRPALAHSQRLDRVLRALRGTRLKLFRTEVGEGDVDVALELFDVVADPGERDDLAGSRGEERERLEGVLRDLVLGLQARGVRGEGGEVSEGLKARLAELGY